MEKTWKELRTTCHITSAVKNQEKLIYNACWLAYLLVAYSRTPCIGYDIAHSGLGSPTPVHLRQSPVDIHTDC